MTKLVYGVGVYEKGKYTAGETIDGKSKHTKVYAVWHSMLKRGYCLKVKLKQPTYQDVTVCDEWLNFQNFASWYHKQQFANDNDYQLDKDLLVSGNKIYSPDNCVLIPQLINCTIIIGQPSKTGLPIGIEKHGRIYRVRIGIKGKRESFGTYTTIAEASQVYVIEKEKYVKELAEEFQASNSICKKTYQALLNWKV